MNGINALTEEQQQARRVMLVMNSLGRVLRDHASYRLREGLPQHFAELSHWAWRGDADGALTAEIDHSLNAFSSAPASDIPTRQHPEYHRYAGLVMVRDMCQRYSMD